MTDSLFGNAEKEEEFRKEMNEGIRNAIRIYNNGSLPEYKALEISEHEIIDRLVMMQTYGGTLNSDYQVLPAWLTGFDKIDLGLFLKGSKKYSEIRGRKGELNIPENIMKLEGIEEKIKEIESNYPVSCIRNYKI